MAKYIKKYADFIKEAAEWDDTTKRRIDSYFVSFDKDEKYELHDFIDVVQEIIFKALERNVDEGEIIDVMMNCKTKIPHNHPRKQLMQCVLAHFEITIEP